LTKLKDIAEYVGVSISTVSRVINYDANRSVNDETREKILEAAQKLGYKSNKSGKTAKLRKDSKQAMFRLGCVVAVPQNKYNHPYFSIILEGVERALSLEGYRLEFIHSMENAADLEQLQRLVKDSSLDGMIVVEGIPLLAYQWIKQHVKVIVGIDISDPDVPVIAYDRISAAKAAVNHLIGNGHKNIGFIGGPGLQGDIRNEKRYRGYQYAMEEAGLTIDQNWVINVNWDVTNSYEMLKQVLESHTKNRPTALFAASDMMAIPAMRAVMEQQLNIPNDIAFFGVDNIEFSQFTTPPLSTINVPKMEMGMIAAKMLLDYLNQLFSIPVKVLVPYELILRQSSGQHQA
jgi:LacI family transcriptional regulator